MSSYDTIFDGMFDSFEFLAGFILIFLVVFLIALFIAVVSGLVTGYGLYCMAKRQNIANPWLAFLPFGQSHILGALVGELELFNSKIDTKLVLPISRAAVAVISSILSFAAPMLSFLFSIVSIAVMVFYFHVLYKLFMSRKPESAVLYTVLSILFNVIALPIIMIMIKDKDDITPDVIYE